MILVTRTRQYFLSTNYIAGVMQSYLTVLFELIFTEFYKITLLWSLLFYRQGRLITQF